MVGQGATGGCESSLGRYDPVDSSLRVHRDTESLDGGCATVLVRSRFVRSSENEVAYSAEKALLVMRAQGQHRKVKEGKPARQVQPWDRSQGPDVRSSREDQESWSVVVDMQVPRITDSKSWRSGIKFDVLQWHGCASGGGDDDSWRGDGRWGRAASRSWSAAGPNQRGRGVGGGVRSW